MKNTLTVIIPFLNEGIEIERTVRSVRMTAGSTIPIILVNDNSTDDYNYEKIGRDYGLSYHKNPYRQGVAASRDIGISYCDTKYFLLLDGHMRFYEKNWHHKLIAKLDESDNNLLCCQCRSLDEAGKIKDDKINSSFAAMINFESRINQRVFLDTLWIKKDPEPDKSHINVPCILGASYACSKTYWQKLNGLDGLVSFGLDEQYISLKVWLSGGNCILMKDIVVGHIFRTPGKAVPYFIPRVDMMYNKLLIINTLFSEPLKEESHKILRELYPFEYQSALFRITLNRDKTETLGNEYARLNSRNIESFIEFNNSFSPFPEN
jgi:glycosyltransferase involved in cell wall biosynthesis